MAALFLRPDADQSDGSWRNESSSGTNLFASVDETSFSDSDYIQSSTTLGDKVRLQLSDPGITVSSPMTVRYRAKRGSGTASAGITGRLFQGATQKATWQQVVDDTLTTYTYTLTSGEFTSISNFNDLFVEFEYSYLWWLPNAAVDLDLLNALYYDSSAGGTGQAITTYLSCTRASTGYAKNADGTLTPFATNTLRIGVGTGLLSEDASTNVCQYSQNITNSGTDWQVAGGLTYSLDATAAPDGTTTADKQIAAATSDLHMNWKAVTGTSAGSVTWSVYMKNAGYNFGAMSCVEGSNRYCILVNLTTGAIADTNTSGTPTVVASSVETLANGWFRLRVTLTAAGASQQIQIGGCNASPPGGYPSNMPTFPGDGTSGIYIWGAQVEQGANATSYMPTTGSTFSRAADNITNASTLQTVINAATGSLVAQVDNGLFAGVAANIVDSNGTNLLGFNASNNALASITATLATGNTANRTTQDKLGLAWTASARSLVLNGGTVAPDASSQTPSSTQHIGSSGSTNFANAYIERITVWTTKLADATLQGFTT